MKEIKHIILIPVYNDWKSLNKLLGDIDSTLVENHLLQTEVLIINDFSSSGVDIEKKDLKSIKKINVINLNKNLGSQKSIAIGLNYLSERNENFYITVMDGDGEDNPYEIDKMLKKSIEHQDYVVTSNRKKREESLLIVMFYKIHLFISFLFSFNWISFGNFTTFNSKNLTQILSNNSSWYAHSSSIIKNCKIKKTFARREKRYFDKSKLGFMSLIEHSLRINSVFLKQIFITALIYSIIIFLFLPSSLNIVIIVLIFTYNVILLLIKKKHFKKDIRDINKFISEIKSV